jgi:hypothetical protein
MIEIPEHVLEHYVCNPIPFNISGVIAASCSTSASTSTHISTYWEEVKIEYLDAEKNSTHAPRPPPT